MKSGLNKQVYYLMVNDYRHPRSLATPEATQVHWRPLGDGEGDVGGVGV